MPLLEVLVSGCVWENIGASQNNPPGYCVCRLCNAQIHIAPW